MYLVIMCTVCSSKIGICSIAFCSVWVDVNGSSPIFSLVEMVKCTVLYCIVAYYIVLYCIEQTKMY